MPGQTLTTCSSPTCRLAPRPRARASFTTRGLSAFLPRPHHHPVPLHRPRRHRSRLRLARLDRRQVTSCLVTISPTTPPVHPLSAGRAKATTAFGPFRLKELKLYSATADLPAICKPVAHRGRNTP